MFGIIRDNIHEYKDSYAQRDEQGCEMSTGLLSLPLYKLGEWKNSGVEEGQVREGKPWSALRHQRQKERERERERVQMLGLLWLLRQLDSCF